MSHDHGGRDSCFRLKLIPPLHLHSLSVARGVTDVVVGSGALLARFFIKIFAKVIRMASLMHESQNVKRLVLDLIIEQVGKGPTAAARKSMRTDVISAFPSDHHSNRFLNSLVKIVTKARGNRGVTRLLFKQPALEKRTEDDLHAGSPKTSSND
jgi:hypothetical protein